MTTKWVARIAIVGWLLAIVGGVGGLLWRIAWPAPILPTTVGVGPTALIAVRRPTRLSRRRTTRITPTVDHVIRRAAMAVAAAFAASVSLAVGLDNEIQLATVMNNLAVTASSRVAPSSLSIWLRARGADR